MYNQNWHVVYGPVKTPDDIAPDTQLTDAIEMVLRMSGEQGEPGPEIAVSVFGDLSDPNGQHEDESWPPAVVTTQVGYEIRDLNGEVNDADYEYIQGDLEYPVTSDGKDVALFSAVKREAERMAGLGDMGWDWNGKSAMHRSGGPV